MECDTKKKKELCKFLDNNISCNECNIPIASGNSTEIRIGSL